jgi:DNA polymerase I-like protein with 3'-5' exonuclease and polymerase domains
MASRGKLNPNQLPLFVPNSEWVSPTNLPDLSHETEVAIDVETRDDSLAKDKGPGFYRYERANPNTGFICGISAAWREHNIYIPLRHYDTQCFDLEMVKRWLAALCQQSHTTFVFHNFQYDWGWIQAVCDVRPPKQIDDTVAMASMVNENLSSFKLDDLCRWQGLPGKDETLLNEALAVFGGEGKQDLWRLPGCHVGPYAEQDATSTLNLAQKLRPLLSAEKLDVAYQVERDLMPVTLAMKQRGIRVNLERTNKLHDDIKLRCTEGLQQLSSKLGFKVTIKEIRQSRWIQAQFEDRGLWYPKTAPSETYSDGQASFEKNFMANHEHWLPRAIYKIKHQYELADKFLQKFILDYAHKGRVYPSINQFRSEAGGARSHRFSYSDPALQQMPSRDDEYAPLIRSCFIPEEGELWGSIDYRQQEYRLIVFVAERSKCRGAHEAAERYRNIPDTDFHDYVAGLTRLPRRRAKDVNFATSYGAGVTKFAAMTGMSQDEARQVMEIYYKELPFVREISNKYQNFAAENGYITMLDGARNHFNLWEPAYRDFAKEEEYKKRNTGIGVYPCSELEAARRRRDPDHPWYGERMKRAFTHKAFNRIIQGTAARQIKKAMVLIDQAGYGSRILLQIHDELGFSFSSSAQAEDCAQIMEEALPVITIPMLTDIKLGNSWGNLQK